MKKSWFLYAICALGVLLAAPVNAQKAERNLPINIEADSLRYDDLKQVSIFSGNVLLTRGSMMIRGAQVEVRQDPQGYQFAMVTSTPGEPAFFRQKRGNENESMEGEAEVIEFDGRSDQVKLLKNAQLRRYRGSALADDLAGAEIRYNNTTDVFSVAGSSPTETKRGRVRAMLTPNKESAPAAPTATAATSAAPPPGAALRMSTTLSEGKE